MEIAEQIEKLTALKASTLEKLSVVKTELTDKMTEQKKLDSIVKECELSILLLSKYSAVVEGGEDVVTSIAEDNLRLLDGFDEKYKPLINERVMELKRQIENSAYEVIKKDEALFLKERAVKELAASFAALGDKITADKILGVSVDTKTIA